MDDQGANRERWRSVKRIQIGLRLLLLLVALFAVVFAYVGIERKARRDMLLWEIKELELNRKQYPTSSEADRKRLFSEIDAEIKKRRQLLGEED